MLPQSLRLSNPYGTLPALKNNTYMAASKTLKNYIELTWMIAKTDFKLRYYGSYFGYLWSLMKPLVLFGVMYVVFSVFMRFDMEHYQLYLLLGIVLWNFFAEGTSSGVHALASRVSIIKKIYFPRIIVVIASSVSAFLGLFFNLIVFWLFLIISGVGFSWTILMFPLMLILVYLMVLGFSLILSALYIKLRDIHQIWELCIQMGFWLSPIVYPLYMVPEKYHTLLYINPMTGIIQYSRFVLVEHQMPPVEGLLYVAGVALLIFIIGFTTFQKLSPLAAEEL